MPSHSPGGALFCLAISLLSFNSHCRYYLPYEASSVPISSQATRQSGLPLCPCNILSQAFPNFFTSWYTQKMAEGKCIRLRTAWVSGHHNPCAAPSRYTCDPVMVSQCGTPRLLVTALGRLQLLRSLHCTVIICVCVCPSLHL